MPSRIEQASIHCNHCGRPTMHQRTVNELNHVAHLLATVFCCPVWAPFWLLLTILNSMERHEFFCSICRHAAGALTTQQQAAAAAWQAEQNRQRIIAGEVTKLSRAAMLRQWRAAAFDLYASTGAELPRIPGRIDAILRTAAGEGNEILHWFFRAVVVSVIVACLGLFGWYAGGVMLRWLNRETH